MGARTIVVLLALVGGLVAVLLLTDERPKPRDIAEMAVLDGRSLRECKRIWWQFAGRAPVEVSRTEGNRFAITEPLRDAVSPAYLKQIFDTWDSAKMRAVPLLDDDAGREQAGLAPPELKFTVEFDNGVRFDIDVGAPGPLGSTRFLRKDGKIWEGGEALVESMRVGTEDLRDRAVFRNTAPLASELRVEQLSPTGKREAMHLKREGGEWRLLAPRTGRVDGVEAQRFLVSVLSLRVDYFVPGITRLPEDEPAIVIVANGAQGEETVRLWERDGQVFGQLPGRGITFTSDNRQYSAVFVNAVERLRARILVPMASVYEELVEVVIDPGQGRGDRLRLLREGTGADWRLLEPLTFPGNPTACNEAAQAINNLIAMEFVDEASPGQTTADDPQFGLGPGRLVVSVRGEQQRQPVVLWFGKTITKQAIELVYACRADEPQNVVLVNKTPVEHLQRPWTDYCALALVRQPGAVERIDLARRATGERRTFRRGEDHWLLEGKEGSRDDVGEFANDVLRDLDGKRAVDVRGPAFAAADWTVTLSRGNGDVLVVLKVWERAAGEALVVQNGDTGVGFEIGPLVDKQLRELWQ